MAAARQQPEVTVALGALLPCYTSGHDCVTILPETDQVRTIVKGK